MSDRAELETKLAKVVAEIRDMSTSSYSQSNPARALGLRSLLRIKERLESQLAKT